MVLTLDGATGVPYYAIDLLYIFHIDMQLKYFKYLKYQIVFQTTGYSIQHWYECCIKYQQFRVNNSFLWIICSLACHLSISLTNESSFEVMVEQTILVTTLKIFEIKKCIYIKDCTKSNTIYCFISSICFLLVNTASFLLFWCRLRFPDCMPLKWINLAVLGY